MIKYLLR